MRDKEFLLLQVLLILISHLWLLLLAVVKRSNWMSTGCASIIYVLSFRNQCNAFHFNFLINMFAFLLKTDNNIFWIRTMPRQNFILSQNIDPLSKSFIFENITASSTHSDVNLWRIVCLFHSKTNVGVYKVNGFLK